MPLQKTKTVKISSKNQLTLPTDFLEEIGITKGDFIQLLVNKTKRTITIKSQPNPIASLRGILKDSGYSTEQFLKEKREDERLRDIKLGLSSD